MNYKVIEYIDNPSKKSARYFSGLMVILIYLSIINVIVFEKYSLFFNEYEVVFNWVNYFILFVFSIDLVLRIIFTQNRLKYFTSYYGIIDILSVVPEVICLFVLPTLSGQTWLRVLKLFRIIRILKVVKFFKHIDGTTGKLIPFIAIAIAYKGVVVMFEQQSWWPNTKDLTIVIAVIGFSLSVLLGTKLSVVNSRIYQIEDAVCRIVGSLRDMQNNKQIQKDIYLWSSQLEETLKYNKDNKEQIVNDMRLLTDKFENSLELAGVGGPNTSGFHRDVAYLLHRALAKTPVHYENFLRTVTIVYIAIVIFVIPGFIGLIASTLLVFVLGGMYFLIEDMDSPLDYSETSFIDVKLDALELYNKNYAYK